MILIIPGMLIGQSNFDPEAFMEYRNSLKGMTLNELVQKYPAQTVYYSSRKDKTDPGTFQYLDSMDMWFSLTNDEKQMISDNHFMVSERLSAYSFADAIVNIYSSDLPFFLSTDLVLHALHASYDKMLQRLEYELLEGNLELLITAMRDHVPVLFSEYSGNNDVQQAIKDADLFLSVGLSLLKDETIQPLYDESGNYSLLINEIMKENPGLLNIQLFSDHYRKFDASQFTPRGHYTEDFWTADGLKNLKNYFRSMMWFGRADFFLTPPPVAQGEDEWSEEDIKRMNAGAVVVNELLNISGKKSLLELHEKIIGFFVGPEDNLSPIELDDIISELAVSPEDMFTDSKFTNFQEKINSSDDYGQKILSNFFIVDADKENPAELPVSYKLLGQKFLIDSYVFSQVVYDQIYYDGKEVHRMLPDPLDVMFVLGNEDALPLLEDEILEYHYAYKLEELRYLTESYDEGFWSQSLYNTWLNAIRSLNPPENKSGYPYFMKTTEWQTQKLNTQLSSWAELRHDNILYAKQSYTGGTSCSFPHVYIEPYPRFFEVLYEFSISASGFFQSELGSLNLDMTQGLLNYYQKFGEHMLKLKQLAEKELRGESFNEEEITYLKLFVNEVMASGPSITGWYNELFYDMFKGLESDFLVVDVHTQPTDEFGNIIGKVMHVGTGKINLGVFCTGTPFGNYEPTAFIGPVMSFHEKYELDWIRLTDEEWSEFFWRGSAPERPDWVYHYLLDEDGEKITPDVPDIPGVPYTGTDLNPYHEAQNIAYVIAFPNPAAESTNLRVVLNKPGNIELSVYDILGRDVYKREIKGLPAGEQNIVLNLGKYQKGLYYIKMTSGNDKKVTKLIVK